MRISRFLLLSVAFAVGTAAVGWWAVPAVAVLWTVLTKNERSHPMFVGLAALLAWCALLAVAATRGPVMVLAEVVGGIVSIGAAGALCITLVYPALVAALAAVVARGVLIRN